MNDGLSSLFIDKHRTDDYVGAKAVHDFIQSYLDELSEEGVSEAEAIRTMNFLSMLFLAPIHHMREECHSYIDGIFLNLQGYPYTHQAIMWIFRRGGAACPAKVEPPDRNRLSRATGAD